ncbi:hypothetical protein HN446_03655 [bacterium]|nr:hypothetical protein [bacterium]
MKKNIVFLMLIHFSFSYSGDPGDLETPLLRHGSVQEVGPVQSSVVYLSSEAGVNGLVGVLDRKFRENPTEATSKGLISKFVRYCYDFCGVIKETDSSEFYDGCFSGICSSLCGYEKKSNLYWNVRIKADGLWEWAKENFDVDSSGDGRIEEVKERVEFLTRGINELLAGGWGACVYDKIKGHWALSSRALLVKETEEEKP